MRPVPNRQRSLSMNSTGISAQDKWEKIGEILDACPTITALVFNDLTTHPDGTPKKNTGAPGMDATMVLRFAIVMFIEQLSYRMLYERVADSIILRDFCGIPFGLLPSFSTLQDNIKKLRPATLEEINSIIVKYAVEKGVEDGNDVRMDTTGVETNIHTPTDASLLWDVIRVLTHVLFECECQFPQLHGLFQNHLVAAKTLLYKINNEQKKDIKKNLYAKLIKIARKVVAYARIALERLGLFDPLTAEQMIAQIELTAKLEHLLPMADTIIDQAFRRVLKEENVPVDEKVFSIFQPHTDILVKGKRDPVFGHKILLSAGKNIILDCDVFLGNPADANLYVPALKSVEALLEQVPPNVATDGGFASKNNAQTAIDMGVINVAFSSPKGSKIVQTITESGTYKRLCKWRAGIEGIISALKRAFGLRRCSWSGYQSFQAYVHCAVLAFNLQQIARALLA